MGTQEITPDAPSWAAFEAALRAAGLPVADLADPGQRFFSFADGAAFGGFAQAGPVILLRSLVVAPDHRGRGLGGRRSPLSWPSPAGAAPTSAWLLTTDAQGFFARHGFAEVNRGMAPPAVAASSQFTGLCPASAVLMCRKPL